MDNLDYIAEITQKIETMQFQLNEIIQRLNKIREELIYEASLRGWEKEEIKAKLEEIER